MTLFILLPIKLELVGTFCSTVDECGQGSKISVAVAPYLWVAAPFRLNSLIFSKIGGQSQGEHVSVNSCNGFNLLSCSLYMRVMFVSMPHMDMLLVLMREHGYSNSHSQFE